MPKHATSVSKLKALSSLFDDEGVPAEATDWEEDFICGLIEGLIIAEEAGANFTFHSSEVEEQVERIYRKFERYL